MISFPDMRPSGRFLLRIPPELHGKLVELARRRGLSLNRLCRDILERGIRASPPSSSGAAEWEPILAFLKKRLGRNFKGLVLFGSAARHDAQATSDVDLLVLVAHRVPLTRDLYRDFDEKRFLVRGLPISPHFVHPPDPRTAGGIWFEAAVDGIVLYDQDGSMNESLRSLRQAIASGRARRRVLHGHPYWIRTAS